MKLSEYFEKTAPRYLISFRIDKVLPLIGEGK